MKINRITAAVCLSAVLSLASCSIKPAATPDSSNTEAVRIAAKPTNGAAGMDIAYEDFVREYNYYLVKNGISTDGSISASDGLAETRQNIIESMIEDRLIREKFAEYGMTLSDADKQSIQDSVDSGTAAMIASLKSAAAANDETLSDEELTSQAQQLFRQIMTTCDITADTFYGWQEALFMKQKLTEKLGENAEIPYSDAENQMQTMIALAQTEYTASPAEYNGQTYAGIWIPEGSRTIQAILVGFDYDTFSEISALRTEGRNEEADQLRQDRLVGLQDRYEVIMSQIVSGSSFEKLMTDYNEDEGNGTFLVTPGTEVFGTEFAECAMGIEAPGGTAAAATDYGYYILHYAAEAQVSEDTLKANTDEIHAYLLQQEKSRMYSEEYEKWKSEYNFEINSELLCLK